MLHELITLSQTPLILTHSACKAICSHPRNVTDELMRELAAHGGVIQMNTVSEFMIPVPINPEFNAAKARLTAKYAGSSLTGAQRVERSLAGQKLAEQFKIPRATLDDFLKHLFHAIDIAGAEHVGIGADMDGGGVVGLEDVSDYPKITLALLKHGVSEADVGKIWGGNTLRLLHAAEELAKRRNGL